MNRLFKTSIFSLALLCSGLAHSDTDRTLLILDGSNSMWGQIDGRSKIEIAREVIGDFLADMPLDRQLGLMVYGHRREADCEDIELLVPVAQDTGAEIRKRIGEVTPRGKTPIGASVLQAAEALDYRTHPATIVLVSDGIETCGVDLCLLAETLNSEGLSFTMHIVGFDLDEDESATLECLASATGGLFVTATDADQLDTALQKTMAAPRVAEEIADTTGVRDIEVRGSDAIYLAGRDDVIIPPRGTEHDADFVLKRHAQLEDPLIETFPPSVEVRGGDVVRILDLAVGSIHFYPQKDRPGWGPAGREGSFASIDSLGGISAYRGPQGPLLGVFLDEENPADAPPPPALDFIGTEPSANYAKLAPELRQVFYIGDGATQTPGEHKEIIAPAGATRLFFGIADGWAFNGPPGYYDDNDGLYRVRVAVNDIPRSD